MLQIGLRLLRVQLTQLFIALEESVSVWVRGVGLASAVRVGERDRVVGRGKVRGKV